TGRSGYWGSLRKLIRGHDESTIFLRDLAEGEGFEPPVEFSPTVVFKSPTSPPELAQSAIPLENSCHGISPPSSCATAAGEAKGKSAFCSFSAGSTVGAETGSVF